MAAEPKDRSAKTAARRKARGEEEIRLHCLPGTRQALAELMAWSGIEEQGEAITLMIHHLHGLGGAQAAAGAIFLDHWPGQHQARAQRDYDQKEIVLVR